MSEEAVLQQMDRYLAEWENNSDPRQYFLACYRLMSGNMLDAIRQGAFQDPDWVKRLLVRFSGYYFDALDRYDKGEIPEVWQKVHDRSREYPLHRLQHILLGINAHINYDLVLTLYDILEAEWPHLDQSSRSVRYADHRSVNEIIYRSIDAVQDKILEPGDPVMRTIDVLFGRLDEYLLSRMIAHWREEVWENAVRLLQTPEVEDRNAQIATLGTEVDRRTRQYGSSLRF